MMHALQDTAFAIALSLGWCAIALAWIARRSGILPRLRRRRHDVGIFARIAAVAALAAVSVYGGSKPGGTTGLDGAGAFTVPRPAAGAGSDAQQPGDRAEAPANGLRFTAFAVDGDRFDFSVAWPATNSADWSAIDVFHKERLDDASWRWIKRRSAWPEDGETQFSLYGYDLPCWETKVSRSFRVYTNEVESPFGVVFTNLYATVPEAHEPRSAFFMLAGQRDADGDGLSDAVELSLGCDPHDPDMDGDGLADGQELALGASPFSPDTDGDGLSDAQEVLSFMTNPGAADTDGDGLSDLDEVGLVSSVPYAWHDSGNAPNLLQAGGIAPFSVPIASPFVADGVSHSRLAADTNGAVFLLGPGDFATNSPPIPASFAGWDGNPAHLAVAALWTELETDALSSLKAFEADGAEVVEFSDFLEAGPGVRSGAKGVRDAGRRRVSMQVVLPATVQDTIFVYYREIPEGGISAGAVVGVHNRDRGYFRLPESFLTLPRPGDSIPAPASGTGLRFRLGLGTDPADPDTDDDGLADGAEISRGTDPLLPDTDGDGVSDSEEVESGTDPNDADDKIGYQSGFVVGNDAENVPVSFSQAFAVPAGTVCLVGVWATSREYPKYTSDSSQYNDTLVWNVTTNGIAAMSGKTDVNALHARFAAADGAGETVPGLTGPAVSLGMCFVEAPTNSAVSVMAELEVTNISDGELPSSLLAALYPLRVVQDNWPESKTSTDFGNRRAKRILGNGIAYVTGEPAAPLLKASFTGLPEFVDVGWSLDLTTERGKRNALDDRRVPASGLATVAGDQKWDIAAALDEIVGGKAVVSAQVDGKACSTTFFIRGKNPEDSEVEAFIDSRLSPPDNMVFAAIARHESKWGRFVYNQFNPGPARLVETLNLGLPDGWGIAQIDRSGSGGKSVTAEAWNWKANLQTAISLFAGKIGTQTRFINMLRAACGSNPNWQEPPDDYIHVQTTGIGLPAVKWGGIVLYNGTNGIPPTTAGGRTFASPWRFSPSGSWTFSDNINSYARKISLEMQGGSSNASQ